MQPTVVVCYIWYSGFRDSELGWKLQVIHLSGTSKNGAGQVKLSGWLSEGKVLIYLDCGSNNKTSYQCQYWTSGNFIGQVDFLCTCPKDRSKNFVISTPDSASIGFRYQMKKPRAVSNIEMYRNVVRTSPRNSHFWNATKG